MEISDEEYERLRHRSRLMDFAQDILIVLDPAGTILDVNEAAVTMHGGQLADMYGKNCAEFLDEDSAQEMLDVAIAMYLKGEDNTDRMRLKAFRFDGTDVHLELRVSWSQTEQKFYVVERDVTEDVLRTEELERVSEELRTQSRTDTLTGIPNRLAFDHAMNEIEASNTEASLAILDLNNFKQVNDTFGHVAGDRLLQHVAKRLTTVRRGEELVARIGGDEFGYVLFSSDEVAVQRRIEAVRHAINGPVDVGLGKIGVASAIGVAARKSGESVSSWMGRADRAMYKRKATMRNKRRIV